MNLAYISHMSRTNLTRLVKEELKMSDSRHESDRSCSNGCHEVSGELRNVSMVKTETDIVLYTHHARSSVHNIRSRIHNQ